MYHLDRRTFLFGLTATSLTSARSAMAAENSLEAIEVRTGGRLGAFVLDTGSGRSISQRGNERFLMCSTTKLGLVGAVLDRVDAGTEHLDRRISYGPANLDGVGYAPDTKAHLAEGGMTVEALCAAAIEHSDNGAANLLFAAVGGPANVTKFVRGAGDRTTRFDRTETALNHPQGEDDTTTPRAYAELTRSLLVGNVLKPGSRALFNTWMVGSTTGAKRIRAGVPADWVVGDKTGTAGTLAADVAILTPPGRAPIVVVAYCDAPKMDDAGRDAALRDVGAAAVHFAS